MRVLVLGGAGFVGASLVRLCLAQNARVTVVDCLDPLLHATDEHLRPVWDRIQFVRADMRDEAAMASAVQGQDIIFNLAGQTSHPLSIQNPLLDADINCLGNIKLLEAIRLHNKEAIVVYASSSTVIGKATRQIVDEDHSEHPLEIYSANKGVAEKYYQIYHTLYDLKTVVLRFANLYGPYGKNLPEYGFINYFIHLSRTGQSIKLFGSGDQLRDVLYVEDAADILWQAASEPRLYGTPYYATGEENLSVRQIAEGIVRIFESGSITNVEWPEERRRIEIGRVQFTSARLRAITGWRPKFNFETGMSRTREIQEAADALR